ncbi:MAG: alpha/beta hydrolase, partial [Devosia sp.]
DVPVTVVQSEHDEFITPEPAAYIARTVRHGKLVELAGVSHFAPLQRPALFNGVVLEFLADVSPL